MGSWLDGIGIGRINQNTLVSFFADSTYDAVTTRSSESQTQVQEPTNLKSQATEAFKAA